jgi:diguanylate cyclase (GGDEF)-like protein
MLYTDSEEKNRDLRGVGIMVTARDFKRELLWDVLRESVALGENYYGSGEQRDYFEDLGINLGFLCHHYLLDTKGDGQPQEELRDPFIVMKKFFEGMGDTIFTASMETGDFVAQLHAPLTSLLFRDNGNCEAFLAGFAGNLAAQRFDSCSVRIRQEKRSRAFFISVSANRNGETAESAGYQFRKDSLPREKPSSYSLISSTLNYLLKKQGIAEEIMSSSRDPHQNGMNERKFKLFAIMLRLAIENDRAAKNTTECALNQKVFQERVDQEKEKVKIKESEYNSLKNMVSGYQEDFANKEREYLTRIGELESRIAQAGIDILDRDAALEEALNENHALKHHHGTLEKKMQQRGFEELLTVIDTQKETIAFMERTLKTRETGLQKFHPLVEAPLREIRKEEVPDTAMDKAILDEYHYHLMDYCERLANENDALKHSAFIDEVTGSFNARYLMQRLEEELNRVRRHRRNLSLVKIGINNLHHIIQSYDDITGNNVLLEITKNMRESLRNIDIITRTGDDEFVILLPETALENALQVAQRVSENLRSLSICGTHNNYIHVSVSGSVLCFDDYEIPGNEMIKAAEEILLHGKTASLGNLKVKEIHNAPVYYIN